MRTGQLDATARWTADAARRWATRLVAIKSPAGSGEEGISRSAGKSPGLPEGTA